MESRRRKPSCPTGPKPYAGPGIRHPLPLTRRHRSHACPSYKAILTVRISPAPCTTAPIPTTSLPIGTQGTSSVPGRTTNSGWKTKRSGAHQTQATDYQNPNSTSATSSTQVGKTWRERRRLELRTDGWGAVRAGKGIPSAHKTKTPTAKCWIWTMPFPNLNRHLSPKA